MKKLIFFLFILTAYAFNSQCQNDPGLGSSQPEKKKCCFEIASLSIAVGNNDYKTLGRNNDFEKHSKELNNNQLDNSRYMMDHKGGNISFRSQLNLEIGLNPYSKKLNGYNKKRELILGLYYSSFNLVDKSSAKFTTVPGDTFSNNSVKYQTDTLIRTHRTYRKEADVLGITAQYLYKTDPQKRLSLFTGYGINAGYAINEQIYKNYSKEEAVVVNFYDTKPDINEFGNGNLLSNTERKIRIKPDPMIFSSIFIPFGVNFRLCKTKEIWDQMNLFMMGSEEGS